MACSDLKPEIFFKRQNMTEYMNGRVIVKVGDITKEHVDAIVNAANSSLMGGGGVDGAIHRIGGSAILDDCRALRNNEYPDGLPKGQAVATTAGLLPAKYIIHTVGPVWRGGTHNEEQLLGDCYTNSLKVAFENNCDTIAFPAISTGVYGYPKTKAAIVASHAVKEFLEENSTFKKVFFVFFSKGDEDIFIEECGF